MFQVTWVSRMVTTNALTPAWGHQRVRGFALVDGLSPEIALQVVLTELVRVLHYKEGLETLERPL